MRDQMRHHDCLSAADWKRHNGSAHARLERGNGALDALQLVRTQCDQGWRRRVQCAHACAQMPPHATAPHSPQVCFGGTWRRNGRLQGNKQSFSPRHNTHNTPHLRTPQCARRAPSPAPQARRSATNPLCTFQPAYLLPSPGRRPISLQAQPHPSALAMRGE